VHAFMFPLRGLSDMNEVAVKPEVIRSSGNGTFGNIQQDMRASVIHGKSVGGCIAGTVHSRPASGQRDLLVETLRFFGDGHSGVESDAYTQVWA
jgi:hypothetical protein